MKPGDQPILGDHADPSKRSNTPIVNRRRGERTYHGPDYSLDAEHTGQRPCSDRRLMKISWLTYLDPFVFLGGGELHNRLLIEVGRRRGHEIAVSPWLRGRAQRLGRRARLTHRVPVDWEADVFVLANIRNQGPRADRFPEAIVDQALATGRAVVLADAWVDVCPYDLPCDGDRSR